MRITLLREPSTDEGTFGRVVDDEGEFVCFSVELPWRENERGRSCIPPDTYPLSPWSSARFRAALHVANVEARSAILIHSGNWGGDAEKGLKTHLRGCIAPGRRIGVLKGQRAVLASKPALRHLIALDPSELVIEVVKFVDEALTGGT